MLAGNFATAFNPNLHSRAAKIELSRFVEIAMQLEQVEIKFTLNLPGISTLAKMEAELRAKQAYVMTLLKQGAITKHRAATLLGITRLDLIELMGKYEISTFSEQPRSEIEQEVAHTRVMLNQQSESRA